MFPEVQKTQGLTERRIYTRDPTRVTVRTRQTRFRPKVNRKARVVPYGGVYRPSFDVSRGPQIRLNAMNLY